jgi:Zn-dependent protease with chaperone function
VLKKVGLLKANEKYEEVAGEGYGYLKNTFWWTGMTLMIIGEICNFVAYAFVDAILVTPLGALSVVITTILSAIFLKERLSMVGKVGCFLCIIGSVVIVMNAPSESSAANIQEMQHFVIAPGFLSYAGAIIVGCAFIALWAGPRYGKKSMLVYLSMEVSVWWLHKDSVLPLLHRLVVLNSTTSGFSTYFSSSSFQH